MASRTTGAPARATTLSSPGFIGRRDELAQLAEAMSKPPALVLVEGEAGIGKTRLLTEWLGDLQQTDQRAVVTSCPPFRQPYTLGPIVDAVRRATDSLRGLRLSKLAGALRPLFPEWADELPPDLEPIDDVTAARHRLFRAWHELLTTLDVDTLVVEDAHWADDATLDFLLFLAAQHPAPVSLLVTYRPEDLDTDSALRRLMSRAGVTKPYRLTLEPLSIAETAEFVSSMLAGEQVSQRFADFLNERSDGLPLAMEELLQLFHDRADVTWRDDGWVRRYLQDIVVPPTVRDAVLERLARLGEAAQAVVRVSAVLTEPASRASLAEVADLPADEFDAGLSEALASRLVAASDGSMVAFRHSLACQAVYESIPEPTRQAMHLGAGRALEWHDPQPVAQLARHFRRAGDLERWSHYAERAADIAKRSGDEATAADLLCELLTTMRLPPRRIVDLAAKVPLGPVFGTDRRAELISVLRQTLRDSALECTVEAELRFTLGLVIRMTELEAGQAEIARAAVHLGHVPEKAAMAMAMLGDPWNIEWSTAEHAAWVHRAGTIAATLPDEKRLPVTVRRMSSLLQLGDEAGWDLAEQIPEDPPGATVQESVVRGHVNLADACITWGRYDEARRRFANARVLLDPDQYPHVIDLVRATETHLDWFTGDWSAVADTLDTLDTTEISESWHIEAVLVAGQLHAAKGDDETAERELTLVADRSHRIGPFSLVVLTEAAARLATIRLEHGQPADALRATDDATGAIVRMGMWVWATEPAPPRLDALIAVGRLDEAEDLVTAFGDGLGDLDAPAPQAALQLCRAILAHARGDADEALRWYDQAVAAWEAMPRPYDALLARERAAACLAGAGRTDDAVARLLEIHEGLTRLGANAAARRVEGRLRDLGAPIRRGRRGYGDQLSPRELEVVRQVVLGRSNREIAEALFRSPKTIAAQLESARRKLNVASRTAVAVAAIEAGLAEAPKDHGSPTSPVPPAD